MPFKKAYISSFNQVFPMTPPRANEIYNSIARAMSGVCPSPKKHLFNEIITLSADFDARYSKVLHSQSSFDAWHEKAMNQLMSIPFSWLDKSQVIHKTISLGAAQKLINLALKDWWALSPNSLTSKCQFLHAPIDQVVYSSVRRVFGPLPSLKGKKSIPSSYIYNLNHADYYSYQNNIQAMASSLSAALNIPLLLRVEVDQLLWKWV
jgi:hypothetical protein